MAAVSKSILTVASVATALMFGGGVYLFMNFGSIAKKVTERVASETLGVDVNIGSLSVNFPEKSVTVNGVSVGNPPGYSGAQAATIDKIYLKAHTLSQTLLNFNDVTVSGTEVYLEVLPQSTNLTDIKNTVNSKAAAGDKAAQQIKVIIENMRIERLRVNPRVLLLTAQDIEPIVIPDIVLTGIGRREGGVLASEAIAQIWDDVVKRVSREANKAGFYEGVSPEALEGLGVGQIQRFKDKFVDDIENFGESIDKLIGRD